MSNKGGSSCRFIMKVALFVLFVNAFRMARGSSNYSYEFDVHPVEKCPLSKIEFEIAAKRRNCTEHLRYLCAPDKHLSSLIEFCTDRKRALFQEGNCLQLEDKGDLNHYKCKERFVSGCPTKPYRDDEIYIYPACLKINVDFKCFVADKDCPIRMFSTTENVFNDSRNENARDAREPNFTSGPVEIHLIIIIAILVFLFLVIIIAGITWFYKTRKKGKVIRTKQLDEEQLNEHLLDDIHIDETHEKEPVLTEIQKHEKEECETQINKTQDKETQKEDIQIDEKKLRKFLSEGELSIRHVRCIIVGCAGAGKTTLLKRLQDVTFDELKDTDTTEMVDVHVNSFELLEEKETIQSVKKENELPTIIFPLDKFQNEDPTNSARKLTEETEECESKFIEEKNDSEGIKNDSPIQSVTKDIKETTKGKQIAKTSINDSKNADTDADQKCVGSGNIKPIIHSQDNALDNVERGKMGEYTENDDSNDNELYAISKIMDAVKQLSNEKLLHPRITFLDFAGQRMYYAFHQIYLSPKTCYILVVDLTQNPKNQVIDTNEIGGTRFESWTYKDYFRFWLKSIDSFSDTESRVIVVGTHKDMVSDQECQMFFKDFFALFDPHLFHDLRRHLHEGRKYAIGFPESGSELQSLNDIKNCIAKIVQDPAYLEQIPPVWAIFEHILQREKKSKKIISRTTLSKYNMHLSTEYRMAEEEITKMLIFLHKVGTLLYFDEASLKNTIILDIQWFVDSFKAIIKYPLAVEKATDKKRKHFQSTGELDDEELNDIWNSEQFKAEDYITHKKEILFYMEHLGLLLVSNTERPNSKKTPWYYIPSMNTRKFDKNNKGYKKSSILCFEFKEEGQHPMFLFYGVVLKCLKIPNWSILTEEFETRSCIYELAACLSFQSHIVVICACRSQIQVQVWLPEEGMINSEVLFEIRQAIEEIIKSYKNDKYFVGYKCKNGVLNDENDNSFVPREKFPVFNLLCESCKVGNKHYISNEMCWDLAPIDKKESAEANEEIDEGLVSKKHILKACEDGNIEDFDFHLKKELRSRTYLLMRPDRNGWNVLHMAAKGGNIRIFRSLVSENLDLCDKTHNQMTVLHIASRYGNYEICEYILNNQNDKFKSCVCDVSSEGKNACHYAAEAGSVDIIKLLVKKDINATAVTNKKENIFHIACIYNRLEMCKYIFSEFNDLVIAKCEDGWNATLHAAKNGHVEILKFLKEKKISLEHQSESNRNVLHIACDNQHLEACEYLVENCPFLLNVSDHKGRKAVHFAARSGNVKLLQYLETKTELTQETYTGMNILHMACLHDHFQMCKYILEWYPGLNVKVTENGWTTAHFVAGRGNNTGNEIKIFEMLLKAKIPVNRIALTSKGNSVLTLAIKYNVYEFAAYLFENYPGLLTIHGANNPSETGNEKPEMLELIHRYLVQ